MNKLKELYQRVPKSVRESVKMFLRLTVIGVVSYLASGNQVERAVIFGIVLKSVDTVLHEVGKEYNKPGLVSGLTRF